jgi:hypothetical protein
VALWVDRALGRAMMAGERRLTRIERRSARSTFITDPGSKEKRLPGAEFDCLVIA